MKKILAILLVVAVFSVLYMQRGNISFQPSSLETVVNINGNMLKTELDSETNISTVKTYLVKGSGTSMYPVLRKDNFYFCVEQTDYDVNDIVAYQGSLELIFRPSILDIERGYRITGHRIIKIINGYYWIKGDNDFIPDVVTKDKIFCRILV